MKCGHTGGGKVPDLPLHLMRALGDWSVARCSCSQAVAFSGERTSGSLCRYPPPLALTSCLTVLAWKRYDRPCLAQRGAADDRGNGGDGSTAHERAKGGRTGGRSTHAGGLRTVAPACETPLGWPPAGANAAEDGSRQRGLPQARSPA